MKRVVLVTAFEPFDGEAKNASHEALVRLEGAGAGGVELSRAVLPVSFGRAFGRLREAIDACRPEVVVCLGEASKRAEITPERVAINLDDARIDDNDGARPIDVPVVEGGPAAYFSTLPVKAMAAGLRAKGVPASESLSAGSFVCNHVFYALMHLLATELPGVRGGFVHVPCLPEQAIRRAAGPGLALERLVEGVAEAVRIAASAGGEGRG